MLELLISVLLSFGFSFDSQGKLTGSGTLDKDSVYQQVKSNADYQNLGGDRVLYDIVVPDVDPK
jgi:hypothetical protein